MGQVYTYDSAKGIVAMNPTGHFSVLKKSVQ